MCEVALNTHGFNLVPLFVIMLILESDWPKKINLSIINTITCIFTLDEKYVGGGEEREFKEQGAYTKSEIPCHLLFGVTQCCTFLLLT